MELVKPNAFNYRTAAEAAAQDIVSHNEEARGWYIYIRIPPAAVDP